MLMTDRRVGATGKTITKVTLRGLLGAPRKSHRVRILWPVAQLTFQRARTEENKRRRAAALVEAARSLAVESGVASVTLTAVAGRAGIHYSAVRRYFSSHKEVLMHLAAEGWVRFSEKVCAEMAEAGPRSPTRPSGRCLCSGEAAPSTS